MIEFNPMTIPIQGNQLIEASAGTGKTYAITNLFLRLLLGRDDHWPRPLAVNEILVLTFTIAATDELKDRIAKRIRAAHFAFEDETEDEFLTQLVATSLDPERDRKLLTAASQLLDEASIFTIHGFCARVLAEQSFESGVLFDQQLNADRDPLLRIAAEDCFRRDILQFDTDKRRIALSLWPNPDALAISLKPFLFRGELRYQPPYTEAEAELAALSAKAAEAKTGWLAYDLESRIRKAGLHKGRTPMTRLSAMIEFCTKLDPDPGSELWQVYSQESLVKASTKNSTLPKHPVLDLIDEIAHGQHVLATVRTNLWHELSTSVSQRLKQSKDDSHRQTFDDLLTGLAEAVSNPRSSLKETIAQRWPVAMIDEFQDTDPVQNEIFTAVYTHAENSSNALLMIGDPKQAIYNFRGADIYTYINARRAAVNTYSLSTNRRSSPALIKATNLLFDHAGIFDEQDLIPYHAVSHPPEHETMAMRKDGREMTPYQLFHAGGAEAYSTMPVLRETLMNYAAEETATLLNESADNGVTLDGEPLHAGHIAFLVRSRTDASAAQTALAARGIQSVYMTLESVFLQDTANDVKLILEAVMEPTSDLALRAALASRLMQSTADELNLLNQDVQLQQQLLEEFQHYHDLWSQHDVAPMLNTLIDNRRLAEKWLQAPDGERQLTNLRHLVELLQEQSLKASGMHRLIKWFVQQQDDAESVAAEERQLRLESDENLVKIVTMHAAKGLEYDVVMIPMPYFSAHQSRGPILYHEETVNGHSAVLDLEGGPASKLLSQAEALSEDMRLLYVALTRARYRCYLGLPKCRDFSNSAFAKLLGITALTADDHLPDQLKLPADLFQITDANLAAQTRLLRRPATEKLQAPPPAPAISDQWRVHSYTSVANRISQEESLVQPGYADDDRPDERAAAFPETSRMDRFSFPRGSRVGIALHSLMEDIDFVDDSSHQQLCERTINRLNLDPTWVEVLTSWLRDMLSTPLPGAGISLTNLSQADRLDEMEFHFPLAASEGLVDYLKAEGYLTGSRQLNSLTLDGMMTGLIDLVFRHNGKYYLADYKSNHLGDEPARYQGDALLTTMNAHQYDLQYLIYTVALTKMLRLKLPDFDYDRDFGGVYYLFLRGMHGQGDGGVFHAKPSASVINGMMERFYT